MKTAFTVDYRVFDPYTPGGFRAERTILEAEWDWYPLQTALILGAMWHAKMQSRNRRHSAAKREAYGTVAGAISGMLHRLEDMVTCIDGDGLTVERERSPDWTKQEALNVVVADIQDWVSTGTPRYRIHAWAPQWEPLRQSHTVLESFGEHADSAIFNAVLDMEALQGDKKRQQPWRQACSGHRTMR